MGNQLFFVGLCTRWGTRLPIYRQMDGGVVGFHSANTPTTVSGFLDSTKRIFGQGKKAIAFNYVN